MRLLLTAPPSGWKGSEVIMGLGGYPCQKQIEQAGYGYQQLILRLSGEEVEEENVEQEDVEESMSAEEQSRFEQKRHKRIAASEDLYEILGLGHLRWKATENDIKSARIASFDFTHKLDKKLILQYHPDKNEGISDEIFKKISNANDILSNTKKRQAYDSQDPFDDSIPSVADAEKRFFSSFSEAFERFSKWSVTRKIPQLGDENTPYEEVKSFYDFWFSFKSWRDFSYEDEFDVEEAESREERRWMERNNEREKKKKKREEAARILRLVEMAEKYDPRIRARKDKAKEEKMKAKKAKAEAARLKAEEQERKEAEEKAKQEEEAKRKAEEAAALKKAKANENKKFRKLKSKLRTATADLDYAKAEDVEYLCGRITPTRLADLMQIFENGTDEERKTAFLKELESEKASDETFVKAEETKSEVERSPTVRRPWSEEELALLAKALSKYPGGTTKRWELVAAFLGTRNVKEIIAKAKEANQTVAHKAALFQPENEFEKFVKTKKGETLKEVTPPSHSNGTAGNGPVPNGTPAVPTETAGTPEAEWTPEEQKLLEQALKRYPTSLGKDRWDYIAQAVPSRSRKECVARFKYLVAQIKEKKG